MNTDVFADCITKPLWVFLVSVSHSHPGWEKKIKIFTLFCFSLFLRGLRNDHVFSWTVNWWWFWKSPYHLMNSYAISKIFSLLCLLQNKKKTLNNSPSSDFLLLIKIKKFYLNFIPPKNLNMKLGKTTLIKVTHKNPTFTIIPLLKHLLILYTSTFYN